MEMQRGLAEVSLSSKRAHLLLEMDTQRKEEAEAEDERDYVALWHPEGEDDSDGDGDGDGGGDGDAEIWPVELNSQIWRNIDHHLLMDCVFSHLPFFSVLRFRAVSRACNTHLVSCEFWQAWYQKNPNPNSIPQILLLGANACASYDDDDCKGKGSAAKGKRKKVSHWKRNNSISFVPSSSRPPLPSSSSSPMPPLPSSSSSKLRQKWSWCDLPSSFFPKPLRNCNVLCSGGGLFVLSCTSTRTQHEKRPWYRIFVCNPINKSYLELPKVDRALSREEEDLVPSHFFIIVDNHDNQKDDEAEEGKGGARENDVGLGHCSFRVVFTLHLDSFLSALVYFSGSGTWTNVEVRVDHLSPSHATSLWHVQPLTELSLHMFAVFYQRTSNQLLAFDPFPGISKENAVFPLVPLFWQDSNSRWSTILYLDNSKIFVIYKWNTSSCAWAWTKALPDEANHNLSACGSNKRFLGAKIREYLFVHVYGSKRVFIYNLESAKWRWSPMSRLTERGFVNIFPFIPKPYLKVGKLYED